MTVEEAKQEAEGKLIGISLCWKCDSAQEHLKEIDDLVILCIGCGGYFYKGQEITEEHDEWEKKVGEIDGLISMKIEGAIGRKLKIIGGKADQDA